MPNRILHERICVSETVAQLAPEEERFFYRLLVQCDDYGRFDGRESVIRARCFPLQLDGITEQEVGAWLEALVRVGLVRFYATADGQRYLEVVTWNRYQQTRAKSSKYPDPVAPASSGNQVQADAGIGSRIRGRNPDPVIENREPVSNPGECARAAAAAPPESPPLAKSRTTGPSLAPLLEAFAELGLPPPSLVDPKEQQAVGMLLRAHPPPDVARCWQDVASGEHGDVYDQEHLSFQLLAKFDRVGNWKRLKEGRSANGKPRMPTRRAVHSPRHI